MNVPAFLTRTRAPGLHFLVLDPRRDLSPPYKVRRTATPWFGCSKRNIVVGSSAEVLGRRFLGRRNGCSHLAFGALTWPHQLVRIMLLEQIYRSVTIMSGHPYHRE